MIHNILRKVQAHQTLFRGLQMSLYLKVGLSPSKRVAFYASIKALSKL